MQLQIILLFVQIILVPAYLVYILWRGRENNRLNWLLKVGAAVTFMLYIFLVGRWDWLTYYLRYVWPVLVLAAIAVSYRRIRGAPWLTPGRGWRGSINLSYLLTLLLGLGFLAFTVRGFLYPDNRAVHLQPPLRDGTYYVGQGGNSTLLNYHNSHPTQKFALDILALNDLGARARGVYPSDPQQYVIFGHTVHSPCDGAITEVVETLPDQNPPQTDTENVAGNHLVIRCQKQEATLLLAHLQQGSLMVQNGDTVSAGDPLARVGNSGNTTEPHLHIHAVAPNSGGAMEGDGVPILIDGDFPVRNALLGS